MSKPKYTLVAYRSEEREVSMGHVVDIFPGDFIVEEIGSLDEALERIAHMKAHNFEQDEIFLFEGSEVDVFEHQEVIDKRMREIVDELKQQQKLEKIKRLEEVRAKQEKQERATLKRLVEKYGDKI